MKTRAQENHWNPKNFIFGRRILLIRHYYDFRLEWAHWQQPIGLLQIAAHFRSKKKDVRLIDCLQPKRDTRLHKHKLARWKSR